MRTSPCAAPKRKGRPDARSSTPRCTHSWSGGYRWKPNSRKAIEHGDLRVFYQPIVRLATGRIAGVEALVRWWHNDSEIVSPGDFIEIAEETGLIVHIGRWVFKEACRQAHAWHVLFNSGSGAGDHDKCFAPPVRAKQSRRRRQSRSGGNESGARELAAGNHRNRSHE